MVSFMATDTFNLVNVSCFSAIENLLMMKSIPELAPEIETDANADMTCPSCWSAKVISSVRAFSYCLIFSAACHCLIPKMNPTQPTMSKAVKKKEIMDLRIL